MFSDFFKHTIMDFKFRKNIIRNSIELEWYVSKIHEIYFMKPQ